MRQQPVPVSWPTFDAPLLQSVAAAFWSRHKAIAYHREVSCEREFSESGSGVVERLNLNVGDLRLSVWADGVMWLAVSVRGLGRSAGWAFKDTFHGEIHDVPSDELVGMVEATLALRFGTDPVGEQGRLRGVWARVRPTAG